MDTSDLDAIRDVERDMFTGRNTLLHEVLDFFLDYDIKKDETKDNAARETEIGGKSKRFRTDSQNLISQLMGRMDAGKAEMLKYAIKTGAAFNNAVPDFEGELTESELFTALRLIVSSMGITVPASHNGLGYNNLIYISLLLAKMQASTSKEYLGINAKLLPLLIIEEPEAHLHPSMQYQLLDFLKEQKDKVKQVFVTTHSTHITSSLSMDDMIILHKDGNHVDVGYPSKAITDAETKEYVERFLDATKSTMLFANKIIMVEGIAESLLLPAMAKNIGVDLDEQHIVVVNIGGRYFERFLSLFDETRPNTISVKVACITDFDPMRKEKDGDGTKVEACYPYEFGKDEDKYEYLSHGDTFVEKYKNNNKIKFFTQPKDYGKTLEYEIAWFNPSCKDIVTASTANADEIISMMNSADYNEAISKLRKSDTNERIKKSLSESGWSDEAKRKALIASRYLNSVGKGANALELSTFIWKDAKKAKEQRQFVVPKYIKEAIEWLIK